ncbi:unnamed protein product [Lactuca virosa]|uniref:Uncharacterized protein n=1 Tax=Lactuca virosa TaxID=75947 RepID=A0AAU9MIS5_9ASTR|nr:unnamed protein product [Lactuca virosa]
MVRNLGTEVAFTTSIGHPIRCRTVAVLMRFEGEFHREPQPVDEILEPGSFPVSKSEYRKSSASISTISNSKLKFLGRLCPR